MRLPTFALLSLLTFLAAPQAAGRAESTKELQTRTVRSLRARQNEDGGYGAPAAQPLATIRVLRAFGRCRDHYTTQDGPFVRRAVEFLVARQNPDGSFGSGPAKDVARTTAEALDALWHTAKLDRYREVRARARRFLEALPDDLRADPATQLVLSGRELVGDAAARWSDRPLTNLDAKALEALGERLAADLGGRLEVADAEPTALADLLLAVLDVEQLARRAREAGRTLAVEPPSREEQIRRVRLALDWLGTHQDHGRFGFGDVADPGITGLALAAAEKAAAEAGLPTPDWVREGLDWLQSLQKPDGGIYEFGLKNYITSVAVEALSAAHDPRYSETIQKATDFLVRTQLDEGEGYSAEEDPYYGGFGYGSSEKPDLSNTQMALQALHEAGLPPDHEAYRKAVLFLEKCQNRKENGAPPIVRGDDKVVVAGEDGGAVYRPGDSKAGLVPDGKGRFVARSYGSMTYALLKSYLFSGLDPDDPRVQDAVRWIRSHFHLDRNPGFPQDGRSEYQGLFYYYLTLARALDTLGIDRFETPDAGTIAWRTAFLGHLFSRQAEDGHWVNDRSSRWMEGNPVLTTSYALLAWVAAHERA